MDVLLPKLGEGADAGVVVNILVKEGDALQQGQAMIELENEKAVASIPSPVAGRVTKVLVQPGQKVAVGDRVLSVEATGGSASAPPAAPAAAEPDAARPAAARPRPVAAPVPVFLDEAGGLFEDEEPVADSPHPPAASPDVRRVARELDIDLRRLRGSEAGGRIVMADLRAYVRKLKALAAQARRGVAPAPAAPAPSAPAAPAPKPAAEPVNFAQWGPVTRKPLTQLRKTIGQRMTENAVTIPHVTQFDDADITGLMELKKKHDAAYEKQGGKLTLTPFLFKVLAAALKKHPLFNASLDEEAGEIVYKDYYHLGMAVDTEQGLIVPVLRDVDRKSLLELAREVNSLGVRTRERKVSREELKGGTFTLSNQGGIGGAHFTPIINKPEVAILGVGRGGWRAVVRNKAIEQRLMMPLALSYDHRLIDGGSAVRFLLDIVQGLEQFSEDALRL